MQSRKLNRSILALGSLSLLGFPSLLDAQTINRYAPAVQYYTPTHSPHQSIPYGTSQYGAVSQPTYAPSPSSVVIQQPYHPVPHYSVQPPSNSYLLPATPSVTPNATIPQLVAPPPISQNHPVPPSPNSIPNTIAPQVNRPIPGQPAVGPLESSNPGFQGRTLGTPGLITAGTVEQMERSGLVIEEFRPPQPRPEDLSLDGIPLEARQEFYRSLQLPPGSRVMSAQIVTGNSGASTTAASTPSLSPTPLTPPLPATRTLGDPGIQPAIKNTRPTETPKQREDVSSIPLNEPTELPSPKEASQAAPMANSSKQSTEAVATEVPVPVKAEASAESKPDPMIASLKVEKEQLAAETILLTQKLESAQKAIASRESEIKNLQDKSREIQVELENASKQRAEMQDSMKAMADNLQKQMKRLEESHQETARMLEKRTAEVSELQKQLADTKNASQDTPVKKPKKKKSHKDE